MKVASLWPIAIVGVLAITVGANGYLVYKAGDPSVYVVEPDYYRKAVAWDTTLAQLARDAALGWKLDASLGPVGPAGAVVRMTLADSTGAPIAGARVALEAVNNLDGGHYVHARLTEAAPGTYVAEAALPRAGLWELRFDVTHGRDRFTADLRRDAPGGTSR